MQIGNQSKLEVKENLRFDSLLVASYKFLIRCKINAYIKIALRINQSGYSNKRNNIDIIRSKGSRSQENNVDYNRII